MPSVSQKPSAKPSLRPSALPSAAPIAPSSSPSAPPSPAPFALSCRGSAYAYCTGKSICFDIDNFNQWGWHANVGDAFSTEGAWIDCELWKGASDCIAASGHAGTKVADVKIFQDRFVVTKIGSAIFPIFHFYHGTNPYPQLTTRTKTEDTVSPGQYSDTTYDGGATTLYIDGDDNGRTAPGTLLQSGEWFILHANVCTRV